MHILQQQKHELTLVVTRSMADGAVGGKIYLHCQESHVLSQYSVKYSVS
jgi:hypothetical protein